MNEPAMTITAKTSPTIVVISTLLHLPPTYFSELIPLHLTKKQLTRFPFLVNERKTL
ncbi:conserved hypothetical protein [Listeria monocytogenes FSL J2-071]|nr:conserved hypothetical protein [Listeria monocytogenes FSL J2-071]